ncbi:MAG: His/Gly/Thr/Pro-type tRNA ligase C-terminal domain-containing protein, partial [Gammaproteobacteria bacterium]
GVDIRNIVKGEPAADGSGNLDIAKGIEVGHIFQLGKKYSAAMKATCLDENGDSQTLIMGCYGIGVSRILAAAIEQNHDEKGIIWPDAIAPFQCVIAPINMHKSERLRAAAEKLYGELKSEGIDVLLYDARERPGVMFADLDLIGIPHRLVISDRGLNADILEYKSRSGDASEEIPLGDAMAYLRGISSLSGLG